MSRSSKLFLLLCDLILYWGSVAFVAYIRESLTLARIFSATGPWFIAGTLVVLLYIFGSYDISHSTSSSRVIGRTALALAVAIALVIFVNYLFGKDRTGVFGRGILIGSVVLFGFLSLLQRWAVASYRKTKLRKARWLFVVSRAVFENVNKDFKSNRFYGQIFYCLDEKQQSDSENIIGNWEELREILKSSYDSVVISFAHAFSPKVVESLLTSRFETNRIQEITQFYEDVWQKIPLDYLEPQWFLTVDGFSLLGNPIRLRLKRLMDVMISSTMLVLVSPIMLLTALAIRIESPGDIIYRQIRTGKSGKPFMIYKFRSMVQNAEKSGAQWAQKNDSRITKLGNFLRKTRIDELPQLYNILLGSMSFVGPRPERPEFVEQLRQQINFYDFRHIVQPGLTGWAQISYPYGASVEDAKEKLQYDLFYIKNYSLWMDVSVVLKTVTVVLFGKGR